MVRSNYYTYRSRPTRKKRSYRKKKTGSQKSLLLCIFFTVLVGINLYVFFFRGGTSIREVLKTSAIQRSSSAFNSSLSSSGMDDRSAGQPEPTDNHIKVKGSLKGFNGLSTALAVHHLPLAEITRLIEALKTELNMRTLRPEHHFELQMDKETNQLKRFTYHLSSISSVNVIENESGQLHAFRQEAKLETKVANIGGKIDSSLNQAMTQAGESPTLMNKIVDLFSWDINWYVDPRQGDEFRIIVEKKYNQNRFYCYGRVLAAEYRGNVGKFQVYYFRPENQKSGGYYTAEGRAVRRSFLKMPLNFKRISSKYNLNRFHPILHRTKGHFGVDYAAAQGTPIWAVADGIVSQASFSGGGGNMILLRHGNGIVSLYMHLLKFASGIKVGQRVKQKQTIGYVGATGLATGPHLHFGLKAHGRYIDPLKFEITKGQMLDHAAKKRYFQEINALKMALAAISVPTV